MLKRPLLAVLLFLLAFTFAGCGSSTSTFHAHGISFKYPHDWKQVEQDKVGASNATARWMELVAPKSASLLDFVSVAEFHLKVSVITPTKLMALKPRVTDDLRNLVKKTGGKILRGPTSFTVGRLPALSYRIEAAAFGKKMTASRIVLAYRGHTQYVFNCQRSLSGILASEIERGCNEAITSFRLD